MRRALLHPDDIYDLLFKLTPMHGEMLSLQLPPLDRQRLSGYVLPYGVGLVHRLIEALRERPEVLRDAVGLADELTAEREMAVAWLKLRDRLRQMAELANDAYLATSATSIGKATGLVKPTFAGPLFGMKPAAQQIRRLALLPAYKCLEAYYAALQKKRARQALVAAARQEPAGQPLLFHIPLVATLAPGSHHHVQAQPLPAAPHGHPALAQPGAAAHQLTPQQIATVQQLMPQHIAPVQLMPHYALVQPGPQIAAANSVLSQPIAAAPPAPSPSVGADQPPKSRQRQGFEAARRTERVLTRVLVFTSLLAGRGPKPRGPK